MYTSLSYVYLLLLTLKMAWWKSAYRVIETHYVLENTLYNSPISSPKLKINEKSRSTDCGITEKYTVIPYYTYS